MKHLALIINEAQLDKLKIFYEPFMTTVSQPYVSFAAIHDQTRITAFANGKIILQGDNSTNEYVLIRTILGQKNYSAIGSAVIGTEDIFGPLIVCTAYTSTEDINFLRSFKINNIATLTNKQIIEIGPIIAKKFTHSITILDPETYNSLIKNDFTVNRIKARLFNLMFIKTSAKLKTEVPTLLEQFCLPTHYFNYLKDETFVFRDVYFSSEATELNYSMLAANIIARYAFIVNLHQLSKKLEIKLKLGHSKETVEQFVELYHNLGATELTKIAKLNLKQVNKLNLKF